LGPTSRDAFSALTFARVGILSRKAFGRPSCRMCISSMAGRRRSLPARGRRAGRTAPHRDRARNWCVVRTAIRMPDRFRANASHVGRWSTHCCTWLLESDLHSATEERSSSAWDQCCGAPRAKPSERPKSGSVRPIKPRSHLGRCPLPQAQASAVTFAGEAPRMNLANRCRRRSRSGKSLALVAASSWTAFGWSSNRSWRRRQICSSGIQFASFNRMAPSP